MKSARSSRNPERETQARAGPNGAPETSAFQPKGRQFTIHLSRFAAVIVTALIAPLTAIVVDLANHPEINATWLYLSATGVLVCFGVALNAFPFDTGRPERMLLRLYLVLAGMFTFLALDMYPDSLHPLSDVLMIASLAMLLKCGYRPSLIEFLERNSRPGQYKSRSRAGTDARRNSPP